MTAGSYTRNAVLPMTVTGANLRLIQQVPALHPRLQDPRQSEALVDIASSMTTTRRPAGI